jgi:hypothetical protein
MVASPNLNHSDLGASPANHADSSEARISRIIRQMAGHMDGILTKPADRKECEITAGQSRSGAVLKIKECTGGYDVGAGYNALQQNPEPSFTSGLFEPGRATISRRKTDFQEVA